MVTMRLYWVLFFCLLQKSLLSRQLDLKDLWRLVQKDVETECLSDSQVNICDGDLNISILLLRVA